MDPRVCESVFLVGGEGLSDPRDCLVYALDLGAAVRGFIEGQLRAHTRLR
jgi:hypothetical protein